MSGKMKSLAIKRISLPDSGELAEWSKKRMIWVPHEQEGFASATIQDENDDVMTVKLVESGQTIKVSKDECHKMNPPKFDKIENMADLSCLNEACVLHNLKQRYFCDLIYTYSGLFCVVLNPYKSLPIYTNNMIEAFKGKKRHERPPHVFAIAETAYRSLLQDHENQSILCTGESGAGKTENTKKVIHYLAHVASKARKRVRFNTPGKFKQSAAPQPVNPDLEDQLLQANPILEAFGNSKTVKNDNSSRFGKFIRINFDPSGYIVGASTDFYLLEKSRCCLQAPNERSFHFFYQLLKGANQEEKEAYLLNDIKDYTFLNNGDLILPNIDDAREFLETRKSMCIMGFEENEITSLFRLVSSVLLFGNIKVDTEKTSDQACFPDDSVAQKICHLLGLSIAEFVKAFLNPRIKVGRETVQKAQTMEQVKFAIESISKACYERMFKWLVQRLNKSLCHSLNQRSPFIGILDIAGFEIFEVNSFEQVCINYTNEKLQQLFNSTMFVKEQEEYKRENIEWNFIDFGLDLQPTIDLIEKPMGIFALLDEECLFPKSTDKSFVEKLVLHHESHPKFVVAEMRSKGDFAVRHYAGRVDYSANKWLIKNMDPLNDNVVALMQNSTDPFVSGIWKDAEFTGVGLVESSGTAFGMRTKKGMFRTVSQMYKEQLSKLMGTLKNTTPSFVRCIISNNEKKPGKIDSHLVLEQLRCNGVLEGIRICRQGFPNRIPFHEFRRRYELLAPKAVPNGFMDGRESVKMILEVLEVEQSTYRIGASKVFFRAGVLAKLEEDRDSVITTHIVRLQACCRSFLARRLYEKKCLQEDAIIILQRNCASWMQLRNWEWWSLYIEVKPLLQVTNQEAVLREKDNEIKTTKEHLEKLDAELKDASSHIDLLTTERDDLMKKLQLVSEERAELDEHRTRLIRQHEDLNQQVSECQIRLEEEVQHSQKSDFDLKKLQEELRQVETQLEQEQKKRQHIQLDKIKLEERLKLAEERNAEIEDANERLTMERKQLDHRIKQLSEQIIAEEQKAAQIIKLRAKADGQMAQRDELDLQISNLNRRIQSLESQLADSQELLEEETRQKLGVQSQVRSLQSDLATQKEQREELIEQQLKYENELLVLRGQLADHRRQIEEGSKDLLDEQKRRHQNELEKLKKEVEDTTLSKDRSERARRKIENELEDLNHELEATRVSSREAEKRQHKYDQQQTELRTQLQNSVIELNSQLSEERSNANQLKSDIERVNTKLRQNRIRLDDLEEELDKERARSRALQRRLDELE